MLLSIIVPVYNVEPYVEKCLLSLLRQDISPADYEIIVVDDGSTDGSRTIVERIAAQHSPRLHLIAQINRGLALARNAGIASARGDYLLFVDADDYLRENSLGSLLIFARQKKLDILRFSFERVTLAGDAIPDYHYTRLMPTRPSPLLTGREYFMTMPFVPMVWICLIQRAFLQKNDLLFAAGTLYEDEDFTLRMFYFAQRVMYLQEKVCQYLDRPGSIINAQASLNRSQGHIAMAGGLLAFFQQKKTTFTPAELRRWQTHIFDLFLFSFVEQSNACLPWRETAPLVESIRPFLPALTRFQVLGLKNKVYLALFAISPWAFVFFHRLLKCNF